MKMRYEVKKRETNFCTEGRKISARKEPQKRDSTRSMLDFEEAVCMKYLLAYF